MSLSREESADGGNYVIVSAAVCLVILTALTLRPEIRGFDGGGNYAYLMSLLQDGDLDFHNEYSALGELGKTPTHMLSLPYSQMTGRWSNQWGFGAALFWSPVAIAVHLVSSLSSNPVDLLSYRYAWAVAFSTAAWTSLGLLLLLQRLRRDSDLPASVNATTAILLSTPLIFYGWLHGSMSHGVSFFLAVVFMLQFERAVDSSGARQIFVLGLVGGLMFVTRYQDLVWVAAGGAVAIWNIAGIKKTLRTLAWGTAWYGLGVMLILVPQLGIWNYLYGSWFSGPTPHYGYEEGSLQSTPKFLLSVLFSERGGFLSWHPILLLGLVGLVVGRKSFDKSLWAAAILGIILQIYLISSWPGWWGGASFGNRFFISSYPWIALGIAASFSFIQRRTRRWVPTVAVMLLSAWNGGLLIQYGTQMVPRSDAVSWLVVLTNQFTRVPAWLLAQLGV